MYLKPFWLWQFLCSLLFGLVFSAYHPADGMSIGTMPLVIGSSFFALLSISCVLLLDATLQFFRATKTLRASITALVFSIYFVFFIWVQLDFFSKTVFGINSLDTHLLKDRFLLGANRPAIFAFRMAIAGLAVSSFLWLVRKIYSPTHWIPRKNCLPLPLIFLLLLGIYLVPNFSHIPPRNEHSLEVDDTRSKGFDVIMLTFDSLTWEYLDFTTKENSQYFPFVQSKEKEFLYASASYPNACCTHASMACFYTGVPISKTKVSYLPGRLSAPYQEMNLPNILKKSGYETHSFITADYGNPYTLRLQQSFSMINGYRKPWIDQFLEQATPSSLIPLKDDILSLEKDFTLPYMQRFYKFFLHKKIIDQYSQLANQRTKSDVDEIKFLELQQLITEEHPPLFAHYHFMGLHGSPYTGETALSQFHTFDQYIQKVYTILEKTNRLEKTMLIISSDHGKLWVIDKVPLLIRFPNREYTGEIKVNTQAIDIAPTITEYLNITHNVQFDGASLLHPESIDPNREMIILNKFYLEDGWAPPHFMADSFLILRGDSREIIDKSRFSGTKDGDIIFK